TGSCRPSSKTTCGTTPRCWAARRDGRRRTFRIPRPSTTPLGARMSRTAAFDAGALAIAGLTALLWGLTGVFVRLLPSLPPLTLTALRLAIAFAVLLPMLGLAPTMRRALGIVAKQASAYALASLLVGYYLLATAAF